MSRFAVLLSTTLLALAALGAPSNAGEPGLSKLQITRRVKTGGQPLKLVEADKARIEHLKKQAIAHAHGASFPHHKAAHFSKHGSGHHSRSVSSFAATNNVVSYTASVKVGSQGPYTLLVDSGSSNTWVGADRPYEPTSCNDRFYVSYGSGQVLGLECTDSVSFSSNLAVKNQGIGVAIRSEGFEGQGIDGILGVGPSDLTAGTTEFNGGIIPTVTDNLARQGTISSDVLGVFFAPATSESTQNGELTFGGIDASKHNDTVRYSNITSTSPASAYYGVNQTILYGGSSILGNSAGIVDTGTTLLYLATDAFKAYASAVGATLDSTTGLLTITPAQYARLQPLNFEIGSAGTFTLPPNGQIWPRSLNAQIGGNSSFIYLIVNDLGEDSGSGLDFINGYAFLERFYVVFDKKRVGFATTAFTNATSN